MSHPLPTDTALAKLFGVLDNLRSTRGLRIELCAMGGDISVSVTDTGEWEHNTYAHTAEQVIDRMLEMTTAHRRAREDAEVAEKWQG